MVSIITYNSLVRALTDYGAAAPANEASELVLFYCGKSKEWCLLNRDTPLSEDVETALKKRLSGIPLQYILGEAWFYGYRFEVSPACLIPQPDTELLVHLASKHAKKSSKLLDLCTGSGCIAISFLLENKDATGAAIDISNEALEHTINNRSFYKLENRLDIFKVDVFGYEVGPFVRSADIIVSNPPYINTNDIAGLPDEVKREPLIALDGGKDGMRFHNHFINSLSRHLKVGAVMLLEIGYDQSERIAALCKNNGLLCNLHKDFGGNIRVAEIMKNE